MLRGQAVAAPWKAWGLRCVTAVLQMDKRPSAGACGVMLCTTRAARREDHEGIVSQERFRDFNARVGSREQAFLFKQPPPLHSGSSFPVCSRGTVVSHVFSESQYDIHNVLMT